MTRAAENVVRPGRNRALSFGASTVVLPPDGWEDALGLLAEAGAEVVELSAEFGPSSRDIATFDYTDPYAVERASAGLAESGLAVHSIHGPIRIPGAGPGGAPSEEAVQRQVEALCACIDACAALGGRFVVTQDLAETLPPEAPHLASRAALSRLGDYAADHGCVFALENGAEDEEGFRRIVETIRSLAHPGLGICLDTGHAQLWNLRDVPRAVREAGEHLRTCHVHDNLGTSDDHLPPGDGVVPWTAVLAEMERAEFRGPIVLELHSSGRPRDITELVSRSVEFLSALDCRERRTGGAPAGGSGGEG